MLNTFKKLAAQLLIVVFVVGSLTLTSAEAASLGVPGNPRFHKWRNTNYTSCYIRWDPVAGADYYEYFYCWTDGSHKVTSTDCNIHSKYVEAKISGLNGRHVYQLRIRACKNDGTHVWYSTPAFITPWPKGVKGKLTSSSGTNVKLSWKLSMAAAAIMYSLPPILPAHGVTISRPAQKLPQPPLLLKSTEAASLKSIRTTM